jgi:RNA polymerase sigma-70 factor (ECF subfamily)
VSAALERAWRAEGAKIVAALARRLGRLDLAEDAAQDAVMLALTRWPVDGVPANPAAWLTTAAWRRALDLVRHARRRAAEPLDDALAVSGARDVRDAPDHTCGARLAVDDGSADDARATRLADLRREDDLLALLCACCHPALAPEARTALTLRHVAGLTAGEIGAAFLVPAATMEKRLVRARRKLRDAGVRFDVPDARATAERAGDVRQVIYLVFTEGHLASGDGAPVRAALCDEALWLARELAALVPDAETRGLLALLLLQHSRADARQADDGTLLPFEAQDRGRWNHAAVEEARGLLARGDPASLGPYQVEAAVALLHATAPDAARVPWAHVAELYAVLHRMTGAPVVAVNHAYAVGRAGAAAAALARLDALGAEPALARYVPRLAARADLLERGGDERVARDAWLDALAAAANAHQRDALRRRADRLL